MIIRTIICFHCGIKQEETNPNAGWPGWGAIHGVQIDGTINPDFCPECLSVIMNFVDNCKQVRNENGLD